MPYAARCHPTAVPWIAARDRRVGPRRRVRSRFRWSGRTTSEAVSRPSQPAPPWSVSRRTASLSRQWSAHVVPTRRGACMFAIAVHDPVSGVVQLGSRSRRLGSRRVGRPPRAPCRRTAAWPCGCGAVSSSCPVAVQVPLSGSYSSCAVAIAAHEDLAIAQHVADAHQPRPDHRARGDPGPRWRGRTPRRRWSPAPTSTVPSRSNVGGLRERHPRMSARACPRSPTRSRWRGHTAPRTSKACRSSRSAAYDEHPWPIEEPHRGGLHRGGVAIVPVGIQTPPGPATGIGLADGAADSLGLGDVASGDAVATATTDGSGTGGTTVGSRSRPEPAANAPPTSNRAAAASSVMPRPRPDRRADPLASRRSRHGRSTVRSSGQRSRSLPRTREATFELRRRVSAWRTSATEQRRARAVRRCPRADFSRV